MRKSVKNNNMSAVEANVKVDYKGNMTLTVGEITITRKDTKDDRTTETTVTIAESTIESEGNILATIKALKDMFKD